MEYYFNMRHTGQKGDFEREAGPLKDWGLWWERLFCQKKENKEYSLKDQR